MKKPRLVLFALTACCVFFIASVSRAADADPLATLRGEHPRLLFTEQDWGAFDRRVRDRAADPRFDAFMSRLEKNAREILAAPPLERVMTGRRLLHVSREALRRVVTLAIICRATGDDAFFVRAEKEMLAAAAFNDWNPTHFLDTAEMTAALSIGYDWFHGKLSAGSRAAIRRAIVEKGLREGADPSLRHNYWHRNENNWNQVCFGGLSLGALAVAEDEPVLARTILNAARAGIPNGLRAYAPDGVYPEGPGYWSYGTSYQVLLNAALESALGTDWNLNASPGFLASAGAQLQLSGPSGHMFNFSDCGNARLFDPALYWFAKKLNNPALATPPRASGENARFLPLIALWWPDKGLASRQTAPVGPPLSWKGEGRNPVAVFRSSWTDPGALYLACKAGSANVSHGHMDAGSFIFEADGVRWAIDLGMQDYESLESKGMKIFGRTQDAERWTIFRLNNFSHNTLTIGDGLHRAEGRAEFLKHWDERDEKMDRDLTAGALIDMTPVFGGGASKVHRLLVLHPKSRRLNTRDMIEGLAPGTEVRWAMVTRANVRIHPKGDYAELYQDGKTLRATIWSTPEDGPQRFEVIPAEPARKNNYDTPNKNTRILVVRAKAPASGKLSIAVELQAETK